MSQVIVRWPVLQDLKAFRGQTHITQFDLWSQVHNVENLVSKLTRINVASMSVVGYKWNVQRADMRNIRKTLEEMMLPDVSQALRLR